MGARGRGTRVLGLLLALAPTTCADAEWSCPADKLQDAYRISVSQRDKNYGHCSQVCLSPGLRGVAAKHGVFYGSNCIKQGCLDFIREDANAGQHYYLFACPNEVIAAHQPSPSPPPAPRSPQPPPSPPSSPMPPPVPSPPPFVGERTHYAVKYTDMACGSLIATRVATLDGCAAVARHHGNHFFSYNQWWKFCLACEASDLAACEASAIDIIGCHYQVGFAIYQQSFGGPSPDLEALVGANALAAEPEGRAPLRAELSAGGADWTLEVLSVAFLAPALAVAAIVRALVWRPRARVDRPQRLL
jgi:hypothetical protein